MRSLFLRAAIGLTAACLIGAGAHAADTGAVVPPQRLALAQRVVEASKATATMARVMDALFDQMTGGMNTSSDPEMAKYVQKLVKDEVTSLLSKMNGVYADVYAKSFSDAELGQLLDFYDSPTGRLIVERVPEVMKQTQIAMAPLIPAMQRDMLDKMFDHVCEVQKCTAEQRNQLAKVKDQVIQKVNESAASAQH